MIEGAKGFEIVLDAEHSGLPIAIRNNCHLGFLCGYVGVPAEHPWFNINYHQCLKGCKGKPSKLLGGRFVSWPCIYEDEHGSPERSIRVHGGLTYSSMGTGEYLPKGYWWFGFDCGHHMDKSANSSDGTYRDKDYVKTECELLANQLADVVTCKPISEVIK